MHLQLDSSCWQRGLHIWRYSICNCLTCAAQTAVTFLLLLLPLLLEMSMPCAARSSLTSNSLTSNSLSSSSLAVGVGNAGCVAAAVLQSAPAAASVPGQMQAGQQLPPFQTRYMCLLLAGASPVAAMVVAVIAHQSAVLVAVLLNQFAPRRGSDVLHLQHLLQAHARTWQRIRSWCATLHGARDSYTFCSKRH